MFKKYFKSLLWLPSLIALVVYFQALSFGLTWGDDNVVVAPIAKDFSLMLKGFYHTIPGGHFFPFSFLQCFLINSIFGTNAFPFGFHLYQLIMHVISCVLATLIIYKITNNKLIAILMVSLWTVHPLNVETLTRLVCAPAHVPAGTFCLAFLYCFLKSKEARNTLHKIMFSFIGIVFFLISITSYEQYILFPLVVGLLLYMLPNNSTYSRREFIYFLVLPILLIYVFYVVWRYVACGGELFYSGDELITWTDLGSIKDIFFRAYWLVPQLLVHYLRLFFWPDFLAESKADWYKIGNSVWSAYSLFCQILILVLILSSVILRKKIQLFTIGIFWFFICMLPIIQIIPLFTIVDEHYCYLPIIGLFISIFSLVMHYLKNIKPITLIILFIPVFCLLTWRTLIYLPNHKNSFSQKVSMAIYSPPWMKVVYILEAIQTARSQNKQDELPPGLNLDGLKNECFKWLKVNLLVQADLSQRFGPMQTVYKYNTYMFLCRVLYSSKREKESAILVQQALSVKNNWFGWFSNAEFFSGIQRWNKAWEALKKAIELNPQCNFLYGITFTKIALNAHVFNEAEQLIKNYIMLKPKLSHPYMCAAFFYMAFKKNNKALIFSKQAIAQDKIVSINDRNGYLQIANFLLQNRMPVEAKEALKILIYDINPSDNEAKSKLLQIQKLAA